MTTDTRNRLNKMLAEDYPGMTVDQVINHLLDEDWKHKAMEDWQRLNADPERLRSYLEETEFLDKALAEPVDEPPFDTDAA